MKLISNIKTAIVVKAKIADLTKSTFIPAFKSKPITLTGIPYFIKLMDIFSEAEGLIFPRKKPNIKNGIMSTNNCLICLKS